jgi:hypothetical protein
MKKITFEISNEAFDLLVSMKEKYAEYRDTEYLTLKDFTEKEERNKLDIERFLNRNHNGTYYLISELLNYNLVEDYENSWHQTYKLSDFGKTVTEKEYIRNMKLNELL